MNNGPDVSQSTWVIMVSIFSGVVLILSRSFLSIFRDWADEKRRRSVEQDELENSQFLSKIEFLEKEVESERMKRQAAEKATADRMDALEAKWLIHSEWDQEVYDKCLAAGIRLKLPPPLK